MSLGRFISENHLKDKRIVLPEYSKVFSSKGENKDKIFLILDYLGQMRLNRAIFPSKTTGHQLDILARTSLWEVGLNYLHGTGHGVGSYLNVHEGPMGISYKYQSQDPGLVQGMILSNEPGYYEDGNFGIRLENLVQVKKTYFQISLRKSTTFIMISGGESRD